MDRTTKVNVSADKRSYDWESKRIGSGNMKVVDHEENKSVKYDLNFLKPYKSHADVTMTVSAANGNPGYMVNGFQPTLLLFL